MWLFGTPAFGGIVPGCVDGARLGMSDNNADKRSVATDALETLGSIIGEAEKRDAIHLAVEPAIAAHMLRAGEDVGFVDGGVGLCENPVGIVDPFLKKVVHKGERFWLVVYPRQITSLRHVWEHPKFPPSLDVTATAKSYPRSEKWLRGYAATIPVHYEDLLIHAREYAEHGAYWIEGGRFESYSVPDEFWTHYENVTGKVVDEENRGSFFSCSC